ncbi:hypothetical protein SMICM17S_07187 [Streptomyces microflavus]
MMAAWAICAVESGRSCLTRVARSSCISRAPATVPSTRMEPPLSGVPPTTTAVMAESSMRVPSEDGSLAVSRAVARIPASAAIVPQRM